MTSAAASWSKTIGPLEVSTLPKGKMRNSVGGVFPIASRRTRRPVAAMRMVILFLLGQPKSAPQHGEALEVALGFCVVGMLGDQLLRCLEVGLEGRGRGGAPQLAHLVGNIAHS